MNNKMAFISLFKINFLVFIIQDLNPMTGHMLIFLHIFVTTITMLLFYYIKSIDEKY